MKLDVDLIRDILLWCEKSIPATDHGYCTSDVIIENYTHEQITLHFSLLIEKEFIKATDVSAGPFEDYILDRLTFDGYEYLEAIKDNSTWKKYKEIAIEKGIPAIKSALPYIMKIWEMKVTGTI